METSPLPSDDLSELERRLSAWQPSTVGLASDSMLFAAGRASARGGKAWVAWPIVSGSLALAAVVLGVLLAAERTDRLALVRELHQGSHDSAPASIPVLVETPATEALAPDGYLALRRQWEKEPRDWAIESPGPDRAPKRPASPELPIPRAWQPGGPSEPL
jgi:hypothetical protein